MSHSTGWQATAVAGLGAKLAPSGPAQGYTNQPLPAARTPGSEIAAKTSQSVAIAKSAAEIDWLADFPSEKPSGANSNSRMQLSLGAQVGVEPAREPVQLPGQNLQSNAPELALFQPRGQLAHAPAERHKTSACKKTPPSPDRIPENALTEAHEPALPEPRAGMSVFMCA